MKSIANIFNFHNGTFVGGKKSKMVYISIWFDMQWFFAHLLLFFFFLLLNLFGYKYLFISYIFVNIFFKIIINDSK